MYWVQTETTYPLFTSQGFYLPFQGAWCQNSALLSQENMCNHDMLSIEREVPQPLQPKAQAEVQNEVQQSTSFPHSAPKPKPKKKQKKNENRPQRSSKRKGKKEPKPQKKVYQKAGRNAISSIAKNLFRRVIVMGMDHSLIQRTIDSLSLSITYAQFLDRAKHQKSKLGQYINEDTFIALMQHSQEMSKMKQQWALVFRVLCRHYITGIHLTHLLNSTKIKHASRRSHFQKLREVSEQLF